jgi:DNA-binding transcriptional LysR family regulator
MELRHLRYFIAVADGLSFSKAAERMHISQPSVSQQIRELEEELGVRLFLRDRKRVQLTETGRVLLQQAQAVVAKAAELVELASRSTLGQAGSVTVGMDFGLARQAQRIAAEYSSRFPSVEVLCHDGRSTTLEQDLLTREIDVAILRLPVDSEHILSESLFDEYLWAVLPKTSRLASRKQLNLKELADQAFLLPAQAHPVSKKILQMCRDAGLKPKLRYIGGTEAGTALVEAGKGVYVFAGAIAGTTNNVQMLGSDTTAIKLADPALIEVGMAWRRGETAITVLNFLDQAREVFRKRSA